MRFKRPRPKSWMPRPRGSGPSCVRRDDECPLRFNPACVLTQYRRRSVRSLLDHTLSSRVRVAQAKDQNIDLHMPVEMSKGDLGRIA
jgi:hypothetical protein